MMEEWGEFRQNWSGGGSRAAAERGINQKVQPGGFISGFSTSYFRNGDCQTKQRDEAEEKGYIIY